MCGIAGIFPKDGKPVPREPIEPMTRPSVTEREDKILGESIVAYVVPSDVGRRFE